MNLVIDQGNTFAKVGLFESDALLKSVAGLDQTQLLAFVAENQPDHLLISSVGTDEESLRTMFSPFCQKIIVLNPSTPVPLVKRYDTPHTLGADRVAAAVGAKKYFPNNDCLVIDMGTCITYDLVDANDNFEGGIISPGLRMRFKALYTFTKRLPMIDEPNPEIALIGKSTTNAMQSGVMNGLKAEIEGIIFEYQDKYPNCKVLMCGGDAQYFERRLKTPIFVVESLVLEGLNKILIYNL